jgi:hypothetical protein
MMSSNKQNLNIYFLALLIIFTFADIILLSGITYSINHLWSATNPKPVVIAKLTPEPGEFNYCFPWIRIELNKISSQKFTLKLDPSENLKFDRFGWTLTWKFPKGKTFKSEKIYKATLTSPYDFVYKSKIIRELSWKFKTADKDSLAEQIEDN